MFAALQRQRAGHELQIALRLLRPVTTKAGRLEKGFNVESEVGFVGGVQAGQDGSGEPPPDPKAIKILHVHPKMGASLTVAKGKSIIRPGGEDDDRTIEDRKWGKTHS